MAVWSTLEREPAWIHVRRIWLTGISCGMRPSTTSRASTTPSRPRNGSATGLRPTTRSISGL